jgi:hypothetical protein
VICPVQTRQQKYSSSHLPPNQGHNSAVSFRSRGVGRRHERWDEMRWTQRRRARTRSQGGLPVSDHRAPDERRQSPVEPLGEDGWLRTAKPCGPGARCWCQVGGGFANPTGFDKTVNPPMTVTRRIRRRGERGISRKTIAQGRRNAPTVPVCSCAFSTRFFARETAGAASTRRSLRPRSGGRVFNGSGALRGEDADPYSCTVIASEAKQSMARRRKYGLLRRYAPRNDGRRRPWGGNSLNAVALRFLHRPPPAPSTT